MIPQPAEGYVELTLEAPAELALLDEITFARLARGEIDAEPLGDEARAWLELWQSAR